MPGNERQVERGVMKKQVATETSHWMERGHLEHTFHIKRREGHTLDGQGFSGGTMRVKESQRLSNATKRRNAVQSLLGILNLALLVTHLLVHSSEQRPCAFWSPGRQWGYREEWDMVPGHKGPAVPNCSLEEHRPKYSPCVPLLGNRPAWALQLWF